MFGFGKKHKTPDLSGQAPAHEPIGLPEPEPEPEPTARETLAEPVESTKKPWFGKLFKPARSPLPGTEPDRAPPVEPAAPDSSAKPAAPLPPQPAPKPLKAPRDVAPEPGIKPDQEAESKRGVFSRLRERLSRTRSNLGGGLGTLFLGRKRIDDELMEELETLLITADVGVDATARIIADLTERVKRKTLADPPALLQALKRDLSELLQAADGPVRQPAPGKPQVILMVGVNGAGKTTTIGKLAKRLQAEGNSVMLAAGDTFRAAAVEQLETWGERNQIPVIAQQTGADSASVVFDALQAATARGADVLIADTAGRLHTKTNLMDELTKVARVLKKIDPEAPHEVMLVVDATTGQNALNQAEHFHRAVGLTGITLTKLDGTAKGGILFAIADRLKIPIRFIGVGESIDDLRPFDADEFLDALFG